MPRIDLITGFLGSGKTTFIKKYARFLISHGGMVGILENDYGAVNIDMVLLEDLMGDNCDVEMITGGDGILSHIRRFRTKLISMAMTGYDRVVVEPSGIYDTDDFFDALEEEPLRSWYSPGSIIAIVDANLPDELFAKQLHKFLGDLLSYCHLIYIYAYLSTVAKLEKSDLSGRVF